MGVWIGICVNECDPFSAFQAAWQEARDSGKHWTVNVTSFIEDGGGGGGPEQQGWCSLVLEPAGVSPSQQHLGGGGGRGRGRGGRGGGEGGGHRELLRDGSLVVLEKQMLSWGQRHPGWGFQPAGAGRGGGRRGGGGRGGVGGLRDGGRGDGRGAEAWAHGAGGWYQDGSGRGGRGVAGGGGQWAVGRGGDGRAPRDPHHIVGPASVLVAASAGGIDSREGSPEIDGEFSSDECAEGSSEEEEGELPPSEEGEPQPLEEGVGGSAGRQPSEGGVGGSAVQQPSEGGVGRNAARHPEGPADPSPYGPPASTSALPPVPHGPPASTSALPPVPPWGPYLQRERGWVRITGIVRRGGIRRWGRSLHFTPYPH